MKLYTEQQVYAMMRELEPFADGSVFQDIIDTNPCIDLADVGDNIDTFIIDLLMIAPRWRKLPLVTVCPNGEEVYPSIKMGYENPLNMLVEDPSKMVITWRD